MSEEASRSKGSCFNFVILVLNIVIIANVERDELASCVPDGGAYYDLHLATVIVASVLMSLSIVVGCCAVGTSEDDDAAATGTVVVVAWVLSVVGLLAVCALVVRLWALDPSHTVMFHEAHWTSAPILARCPPTTKRTKQWALIMSQIVVRIMSAGVLLLVAVLGCMGCGGCTMLAQKRRRGSALESPMSSAL
jgi:hypothetical protein